jgi:signal transduction histidine kinase
MQKVTHASAAMSQMRPDHAMSTWPLGNAPSWVLALQAVISLTSAVFYQSQAAWYLLALDVFWAIMILCHALFLKNERLRPAMLAILAATFVKSPLAVLAAPELFPVVLLMPGLAVGYVLLYPQVFRLRTLFLSVLVVYATVLLAYNFASPNSDLPRGAVTLLLTLGIPTGAFALFQVITRYRAQLDDTLRRSESAQASLHRTRDQLAALLDVSRVIGAQTDLPALMTVVLDQACELLQCERAALFLVDSDMRIVESRYTGGTQPLVARLNALRKAPQHHQRVLSSGELMLVTDVLDASSEARLVRAAIESPLDSGTTVSTDALYRTQSWIGVPLNARGKTIGLLSLAHSRRWFFRANHGQLALALANQVASAIVNMHLTEQAGAAAAHNERARLSRELHDSVSQQLFGVSLGARTAIELLATDPQRARAPLSYALDLAEAALVEMRALILELRPESLVEDGLVQALRRQAAAVIARYKPEFGSTLTLDLCDEEPDLSIEAKEAIYRISLEALQNAGKHAQAAMISLTMRCDDEGNVIVEIADNGKGFDPSGSFPGHLGLKSMRERAEQVRGALFIDSAPGRGTQIIVKVGTNSQSFDRLLR